jgi:hypothetical protein
MQRPGRIILALFALAALAAGLALLFRHQAAPSSQETASSQNSEPSGGLAGKAAVAKMEKQFPTREDLAKAATLDSVLASHNDNDPRLDSELKELGEPAKALFVQKYESLPAEKRNALGTIIFLLGRNLRTENDLAFFEKVINSTCRSMENCEADPTPGERANLHAEAGMELSLAYPQVMALKGLERVLQDGPGNPLYQHSLELLNSASHSRTAKVAQVAQSILNQIHH